MKRRSLTGALLGILVTGTIAVGSPAEAATTVVTVSDEGVFYDPVTDSGNIDFFVTCTSDEVSRVQVTGGIYQESTGASDEWGPDGFDSDEWYVACSASGFTSSRSEAIDPDPSRPEYEAGPVLLRVTIGGAPQGVEDSYFDTTVRVPTTPPPPPVTSPSSPRSLHTTKNTHRATLYWSAPASNGGASITGYQVQRGTATSTRHSVSASTRLALFTGLTNGHRYQLWVRAKNTVGYSKWVSAYATPQAPPAPRAYKNCTAMNSGMWPHGVGRSGARDKTSGTPVTTFKVSTTGYQMNDGRVVSKGQYDLDRDNDGIACEKR